MSEDAEPKRLSVRQLKAQLALSGGGDVPLPHPGGGFPAGRAPPLPPARPKSESNLLASQEGSKSNLLVTAQEGSKSNVVVASEEEDSILSPKSEPVLEGSMNAIQLSRPTMSAGRRRPTIVSNLSALIPEENRLSSKDLELFQGEPPSKRSQVEANVVGGENWIIAQLAQMEQDFVSRLEKLEEENACLRQALMNAGLEIPVASPSTSAYQFRFKKAVAAVAPAPLLVVSTVEELESTPEIGALTTKEEEVKSVPTSPKETCETTQTIPVPKEDEHQEKEAKETKETYPEEETNGGEKVEEEEEDDDDDGVDLL